MRKIPSFFRRLTANKVLAALFVFFLVFVGLATVPSGMQETGTRLVNGTFTVKSYIQTIDALYTDMLFTDLKQPALQNKATYIDVNGWMAHLLGQRYMNERIKLNNGSLAQLPAPTPHSDIDNAVNQVTKYYRVQADKGKYLLFVMAPSKIQKYDPQLPAGYTDTINPDADYMVQCLQNNGVPVLDLRETMHEQGLDTAEAFYKTDHHWTERTGFWAYQEILKKLTAMGAIPAADPLYTDAGSFTFTLYPDYVLGSSGKRTGRYFAGVDDFYAIRPAFATNIHYTVDAMGVDAVGRLEDVTYANEHIEAVDYFSENPYGLYSKGNRNLTRWENPDAPIDLTLLMHGDSFSDVPTALLPLCFTSVYDEDTRNFKGKYKALYEEVNLDIVIVMVYAYKMCSKITAFPYFPD